MQQDEQRNAESAAVGVEAGASASPAVLATDSAPELRRDSRGRFGKRNTFALKSGRWSQAAARALLPEQAELAAMLADREAALLSDLGGAEELSAFERDLVQTYQELHAVRQFNAPQMLRSRASARKAAIDAYMACVDRQLKIIGLLGLRRRQRDVSDLSIGDYIAATQQRED